jgi:glycyl-tRNA synthetase beta subunit
VQVTNLHQPRENPEIRNNRLALLQTMRAQFLKIADISRLQL